MSLFRSFGRYFFICTLPLLIGGCSGIKVREKIRMPSSRKRSLPHLDAFTCDHQQTNSGVTIRIKTMRTEQDCVDLFGKNGKYLLNKKKKVIYPVQITIENRTDSDWFLPAENVGLNLAPEKLVLNRVGYWTKMRALLSGGFLLGGAGAITWAATPLEFFIIYSGPILSSAAFCALGVVGLCVGTLTIAAPAALLIHGVRSRNANKQISKMVNKASLKHALKIKARTSRSLLFFVRKQDYKSRFTLVMTNDQEEALLFNVHAPAL